MRFEEAYTGWQERRLTQEEAALLLGVCVRTFRRYIDRFEDEGLDGLRDKRISEVSHRLAPVHEVLRLEALYRQRYDGWSVAHFSSVTAMSIAASDPIPGSRTDCRRVVSSSAASAGDRTANGGRGRRFPA